MRLQRDFFADSVSTDTVQLVRVQAAGGEPLPSSNVGLALHRITVVTGNAVAANADTAFWVANCTRYRVTIERIS